MEPKRLLGPPTTLVVVSGIVIIAVTAGLIIEQGPVSVVFAALAALVAWRLLGLSVALTDTELIVRNILRTFQFPVDRVDVRARIVDPRYEGYAAGSPHGNPEIPTTPDDNTPQAAKWYQLEHDGERYQIDALMARRPAEHERLALWLRNEILAARDAID